MSKIFGYIQTKKSSKKQIQIKEMAASFKYGAPRFVKGKNHAIGSLQPTKTECKKCLSKRGRITIAYTGYLVEPKKTETANDLIELYLDEGPEFVKKLNGSFSIIIHDDRTGKTIIATDRFASRPIYYYEEKGTLVFASEIKAILAAGIKKEINTEYWKDYFSYGFGLGTKTPFKNIQSLENGSILTFEKGTTNIERYWDYDSVKLEKRTLQETITKGVQVLKELTERQTKGTKKTAVLLSGGYDSRCIIAGIKKFTNLKPKAYTIAKSYPHPPLMEGDLDSKFGHLVCDRLYVPYLIVGNSEKIYENHFLETVFMFDGLTSEHIWIQPLAKEMDDETIKFEGIMGDILMRAGWLSDPELSHSALNTNKLARGLHTTMIREAGTDTKRILSVFKKEVSDKLKPSTENVEVELAHINKGGYAAKIFHAKNRTRNVVMLASNNSVSRKSPVRFPFCDSRFAEFALSIDPAIKVSKNIYKRMLDAAFPELKDIPTTNDPVSIKGRLKQKLAEARLHRVVSTYSLTKKSITPLLPWSGIKESSRKLDSNPRDIQFLFKLAEELKFPEFVGKKETLAVLEQYKAMNKDPTYFIEPLMNFIAWYNIFYLEDEEVLKRCSF